MDLSFGSLDTFSEMQGSFSSSSFINAIPNAKAFSVVTLKTGEQYIVGPDHDTFAAAIDEKDDNDIFDDQEGLLAKYQRICFDTVQSLSENEQDDGTFQVTNEAGSILQWELEMFSWRILKMLAECRFYQADTEGDVEKPHDLSSDVVWTNYFLKTDPALNEYLQVKEFLEGTAPDFIPIEVRKGYLYHTVKSVRQAQVSKRGNEKAELDPDAPTRTGKPIAPDDKNYEKSLNRSLFEYVRRGRLSEAISLCRECEQPWKAASLSGFAFFRDPALDGDEDVENGGNVNRSLWKATCYATAREESFDSYERALFAALAGDVENALSVCTQWEDVLWINYLSLLEQTLDNHLSSVKRICKLTEEVSMELPPPAKSPFEIFEALRRSDKKDIRMASFDPFRIFQTMWILNRLDEFFIDFNYQIEDRALSLNYLPHYLRFITHVILFLRSIAYPLSPQAVDSTDQIIRKYVGLLVAAAKYHLVAIFTSQLPNSQQIETHAFMLTNINDEKTTRYKYVRQASDYGLDTNRVLARTVELVFADGVLKESLPGAVASVFLTSFLNPISPSDAIQIRALEWLCYDDSQKEDLLLKTNILLRRFLAHGRLNAAQKTLETLPEENLRSEWLDLGIARMSRSEGEEEEEAMDLGEMQIFSAEAVEFINYKGLLQCAKFYASWRALMGSRPLIPAGKTRATYQYRDWVDQVKILTDRVDKDIDLLLESGWLVIGDIPKDSQYYSAERDCEMQFLRDLYISNLLFWRHSVLYETRGYIPGNLQKCRDLAMTINSVDEGYYKEVLRSGMLPQFVLAFEEAKNATEDVDPVLQTI